MGGSIQILGALFILSAFVLGQASRLDPRRAASLTLNLIGASILALDAAIHAQLGFLLLEGVWALVSMRGLVALLLTRRVAAGSWATGSGHRHRLRHLADADETDAVRR